MTIRPLDSDVTVN